MYKLLFYLSCLLPTLAFSQVNYIDTTNENHCSKIINFSANYEGFYFSESHIDKLKKSIEFSVVSGSTKIIDADSTISGNQKKRIGYTWINIRASDQNDFLYSKSVTEKNKPIKYTSGTIKSFIIELPYYQAKAFLREIW